MGSGVGNIEMKSNYLIQNEEDAYNLLDQVEKGELEFDEPNIEFKGWPILHLEVTGEEFNSTITPPLMRSFLEYQKSVYKSYAISAYNTENTGRLTNEEKERLQIKVKVSEGSSIFDIDLQKLLMEIIKEVAPKMTATDVIIIAVGVAVAIGGSSIFKAYLEHRRQKRSDELNSEEKKQLVDAIKFVTEKDIERTKILTKVVEKYPALQQVEEEATNAYAAILKGLASTPKSKFQGTEIQQDLSKELVKNSPSEPIQVRLDGSYIIHVVDATHPEEFRVKVKHTKKPLEVTAIVQDTSSNNQAKSFIQTAEWKRRPVYLRINAKETASGKIRDAVVLEAESLDDEE